MEGAAETGLTGACLAGLGGMWTIVVEAGRGVGVPNSTLRGLWGSLGMVTLVVEAGGVPESLMSLGVLGMRLGVEDSAVRDTVLGGSFLEAEVDVDESSRVERCVDEREDEAEDERRGGGEETRGSSSPLMVQLSWPGPSRCWGGEKVGGLVMGHSDRQTDTHTYIHTHTEDPRTQIQALRKI